MLGAGGANYQRGDTVGQVFGRAGAGAAAATASRGAEERALQERYELARQQGLAQAAGVGTSVLGQQQQLGIAQAEMQQRNVQHAQTLALQRYQAELNARVTQARIDELARRRNQGGTLGTPAQQNILSGMGSLFYPQAEAQILREHQGNAASTRTYLETAEGRRHRDALAWSYLLRDPQGQQMLHNYGPLLQARPGAEPAVGTE